MLKLKNLNLLLYLFQQHDLEMPKTPVSLKKSSQLRDMANLKCIGNR